MIVEVVHVVLGDGAHGILSQLNDLIPRTQGCETEKGNVHECGQL